MSDVKTQKKHSNIAEIVLRRIKKYYGRKIKNISEEEKQKYKAYFEGEKDVFVIEKLTRDIIECCKLPEAIELKKKKRIQSRRHNDSRRNINSRKNNKTFSSRKSCIKEKD